METLGLRRHPARKRALSWSHHKQRRMKQRQSDCNRVFERLQVIALFLLHLSVHTQKGRQSMDERQLGLRGEAPIWGCVWKISSPLKLHRKYPLCTEQTVPPKLALQHGQGLIPSKK